MRENDHSPDPAWDSARRQLGSGLLSIVMPAYNLGASIAENIREVHSLFSDLFPFEIVLVDDGSTDNTKAEIEKSVPSFPELRPVFLPQNAGKGIALKRGFEASRGNYVLFLDADLDLPPHQVSLFFDIMEKERADVVIGSKMHPDSVLNYPWQRRLTSNVYYWFVKILLGLPIRDTQTGIKLFKREALEWAFPRMLVKAFALDVELLAIVHEKGFRIAESPVNLHFRGPWNWVSPSTVRQMLHDTLAVFYRLRILHYYQSIRDTRMPEPPPLVTIVVAYPALTGQLEQCIEGIGKQTYSNYEVVLLPDSPSGRTWPEKVREVPTGRIRPAEKRNIGIQNARGSVVAFVDDDVYPADTWLQHAVVYFSDPNIAAVCGPASTPGTDPYPARLSGRVYANRLVSGNFRYRYEPERVREVDDYPSCNLLVRADVLKETGGFCAAFWPGEDTHLCLNITKKLNLRIIYDPRVHVLHRRRPLFLPHLRQIARYALHRGYFARHFPETSLKLSYALPSLLLAAIALGWIPGVFSPALRWVYLCCLLFYGAISLLSAASRNPATWLLTWLGVVLTHLVYGFRFIAGLCASRLPGEVRPFDHESERKNREERL